MSKAVSRQLGKPAGRPGIVLVITVLALTALALLIGAFVFVAAEEVLVAHARTATLRARAAAGSAARAALAGWSTSRYRTLAPGQQMPAPGIAAAPPDQAAVSVERLGPGAFLLRARGESGESGESGRARALAGVRVRALELRELLAPFPAALTTGAPIATAAGARVDATAPAAGMATATCDPASAADTLAAVFGGPLHPALAAPDAALVDAAPGTLLGEPLLLVDPALAPTAAAPADAPGGGGLGPLTWNDIGRLADRTESGTLRPAPVDDGATCLATAPANWGAPLDPTAPCGAYFPLIFAPGDLVIDGGVGQGVLAVGGRLVVRGRARFFGAVLVGASLEIDAGASIEGAVRIAGVPASPAAGAASDSVSPSSIAGAIAYRACPLIEALLRSAFDRPLRPSGRWWIPLF